MSADLNTLLQAHDDALEAILDSESPTAKAIHDMYPELLRKVFCLLDVPAEQKTLLHIHLEETIAENRYSELVSLLDEYKAIVRETHPIDTHPVDTYALLVSWGMGNQLSQLFPQDPDYAEVFALYPTVILVFETELWGSTGTKDLFSDEAKSRIQAIFKHTFGVDPVLRQVSPICLSFTSTRHTLLLMKRCMSIPLLITQYLPLIQNAAYKDLICNDFGFPSATRRYETFSFFHQFGSMFYNYGDVTPDLSPFKGRSQSGRLYRHGRLGQEKVELVGTSFHPSTCQT